MSAKMPKICRVIIYSLADKNIAVACELKLSTSHPTDIQYSNLTHPQLNTVGIPLYVRVQPSVAYRCQRNQQDGSRRSTNYGGRPVSCWHSPKGVSENHLRDLCQSTLIPTDNLLKSLKCFYQRRVALLPFNHLSRITNFRSSTVTIDHSAEHLSLVLSWTRAFKR
jgi:hypothetical protein